MFSAHQILRKSEGVKKIFFVDLIWNDPLAQLLTSTWVSTHTWDVHMSTSYYTKHTLQILGGAQDAEGLGSEANT